MVVDLLDKTIFFKRDLLDSIKSTASELSKLDSKCVQLTVHAGAGNRAQLWNVNNDTSFSC